MNKEPIVKGKIMFQGITYYGRDGKICGATVLDNQIELKGWNPQSEGIEDEATMQEPDTTLGITEQSI